MKEKLVIVGTGSASSEVIENEDSALSLRDAH